MKKSEKSASIAVRVLICVLLPVVVYSIFAYSNAITVNDNIRNQWLTSKQELIPTNIPPVGTVIMIHGFTGSPFDLKPLAEVLVKRGYRIVLPVTPGQINQGYSYDFLDYQPEFYINWINNIIKEESEKTDAKPFLVGFSMGGTLSTIAASSDTVKKLVLLAPFYSLATANDFIWKSSRILAYIVQGVPNLKLGAINDPEGDAVYRTASKVIRLDAYDSLSLLAIDAALCIPAITIPILVIGSRIDKVASFEKTKALFKPMKNARIIEYLRANHVILYDYERESILSNIVHFLEE